MFGLSRHGRAAQELETSSRVMDKVDSARGISVASGSSSSRPRKRMAPSPPSQAVALAAVAPGTSVPGASAPVVAGAALRDQPAHAAANTPDASAAGKRTEA